MTFSLTVLFTMSGYFQAKGFAQPGIKPAFHDSKKTQNHSLAFFRHPVKGSVKSIIRLLVLTLKDLGLDFYFYLGLRLAKISVINPCKTIVKLQKICTSGFWNIKFH